MLWKGEDKKSVWIRPVDVLTNVPEFCQYSKSFTGVPLNATYKPALCEALGIKEWSDNDDLLPELENFSKSSPTVSREICRYLLMVMKQLASCLPENLPIPSGLDELPIFPVTRPDGSQSFMSLDNDIFVPDSALLNPYIKEKVPMLDYAGEDFYPLLPFLRRLPLNFISSYEQQKDAQVLGTMDLHPTANSLVDRSKRYIARYLHSLTTLTVDWFTVPDPRIYRLLLRLKRDGEI